MSNIVPQRQSSGVVGSTGITATATTGITAAGTTGSIGITAGIALYRSASYSYMFC